MTTTLIGAIQAARRDNILTDTTIVCNGNEYAVHGLVIGSISEHFREELENKLNSFPKKIILHNIDDGVLDAMIDFCYEGNYCCKTEVASPLFHEQVFATATKYGIPSLHEVACEKFEKAVEESWDNGTFITTVKEVYSHDVPKLRHVVLQTIQTHSEVLLKPGSRVLEVFNTITALIQDIAISKLKT